MGTTGAVIVEKRKVARGHEDRGTGGHGNRGTAGQRDKGTGGQWDNGTRGTGAQVISEQFRSHHHSHNYVIKHRVRLCSILQEPLRFRLPCLCATCKIEQMSKWKGCYLI